MVRSFLLGAVVAGLGLCAVPDGASAQTGLLVAAESGDSDWEARLSDVVTDIRWPAGPVHLLIVGTEPGAQARWDDALGALVRHGARTVVVVPLARSPTPVSHLAVVRRLAENEPAGRTPRTVLAGVPRAAPHVGVARWIERAAAAALTAGEAPLDELVAPTAMPPINVTATRTPRSTFGTPMSVAVLERDVIAERAPNGIADLFRDVPGLDVDGVGTNQRRPAIRGLVGQRVLLLQDGLRLNNSRRRQDSGEPTALAEAAGIQRVEIVRGASSVLYGSDAVGGAINIITETPGATPATAPLRAQLGLRYSTEDNQLNPRGGISGHAGPATFRVAGSYRTAGTYSAPAGSFGGVTLGAPTRVEDTGVEDYAASTYLGARVSRDHALFVRAEYYAADGAGFGFVEPAALGVASRVQIRFPTQRFTKVAAGYRGANLRTPVASAVQLTTYWQSNERLFTNDVFSPFGPPGAGVTVASRSFTDIDTYGFRFEAKRLVGADQLITYGLDLYRDASTNTDSATTTVSGAGPTTVTERGTPRVPAATFRSLGAFVQTELALTHRLGLTLGVRYQDVRAKTAPTPGVTEPLVDATDRTVVAAASALLRLTDGVNLIAAVGRGFRSPNLVERFFSGPSPEGRGQWIRNTALEPETSLNTDLGVRYHGETVHLEVFVFRNTIHDGITVQPTGNIVGGVTEFQNVNVEQLRYRGIDVAADVDIWRGLSFRAAFSHLDATNVSRPDDPLGDTYTNRVNGALRYADPSGRFWVEYRVRHNGRRDVADLGANPVIAFIPSFTVHAVRGGLALPGRQRVVVGIENLTNALYAEAANVGFFRPEPQRNLVLTWSAGF